MVFTTGNRELDKLIGEIPRRSMLLIVGHPGAGKTTLASSICYANTLKGFKCLYVSFYEDKDKLFNNMAKLGVNLADVEAKNLLVHVKVPVVEPKEVIGIVNEFIARDGYSVIVIDSINPIMELYRKKEQRAILLNFFYNLLNAINGLLIAIAEIPWGRESLNLGAIEFVADSIIYLKHRVVHGLLVRLLEVRKTRGSPLSVIEIPFDIAENKGVVIYIPRKPEKPTAVDKEKLRSRVVVEEILGSIYRGDIITVSFPPNARSPLILAPLVDIIVENDLRALAISYRYSPTEIISTLSTVLVKYMGLEVDEAQKIVNKYIYAESINPAAISIPMLANFELSLIERIEPHMVVFHACEIPWRLTKKSDEDAYWTHLVNQLTWLENKGIITVRLLSRVDKQFTKMSETLSDLVIRIQYKKNNKYPKQIWYIWRRGEEPKTVDFSNKEISEKMIECSKKFKEIVKEKLTTNKTSIKP